MEISHQLSCEAIALKEDLVRLREEEEELRKDLDNLSNEIIQENRAAKERNTLYRLGTSKRQTSVQQPILWDTLEDVITKRNDSQRRLKQISRAHALVESHLSGSEVASDPSLDADMDAPLLACFEKLLSTRAKELSLRTDLTALLLSREQLQNELHEIEERLAQASADAQAVSAAIEHLGQQQQHRQSLIKAQAQAHPPSHQHSRSLAVTGPEALKALGAEARRASQYAPPPPPAGARASNISALASSALASAVSASGSAAASQWDPHSLQERARRIADSRRVLTRICDELQRSGLVHDRKFNGQCFPKCFVGAELVAWLTKSSLCRDRHDGTVLCHMLLRMGFVDAVASTRANAAPGNRDSLVEQALLHHLYRFRKAALARQDAPSGWLYKVEGRRAHRRHVKWAPELRLLSISESPADRSPAGYFFTSSTAVREVDSPASNADLFPFQVDFTGPQHASARLTLAALSARDRRKWLDAFWAAGCALPAQTAALSASAGADEDEDEDEGEGECEGDDKQTPSLGMQKEAAVMRQFTYLRAKHRLQVGVCVCVRAGKERRVWVGG
jgi:hypothetical protein